jgi:hypothetical protein
MRLSWILKKCLFYPQFIRHSASLRYYLVEIDIKGDNNEFIDYKNSARGFDAVG